MQDSLCHYGPQLIAQISVRYLCISYIATQPYTYINYIEHQSCSFSLGQSMKNTSAANSQRLSDNELFQPAMRQIQIQLADRSYIDQCQILDYPELCTDELCKSALYYYKSYQPQVLDQIYIDLAVCCFSLSCCYHIFHVK